jgi:lipopolysaccharide transport system ATP-binding protein
VSEVAIRAEALGKRYRIGGRPYRYATLRDTVSDALAAPIHLVSSRKRPKSAPVSVTEDHVWALRNVSFEAKHGEVIGLIGRNGAGKSTLLKILSRITEPTEGYAQIHGRVGSLLDVGTGFHGELTGRENIYLNGATLGMKKADIDRQFDEIVAFAEIDTFIDTPVKHYSDGMYLRLAFAVAAHLESEILLVDEVLAVGDQEFQRKCLDKMSGVARQGRTILFVSHSLGMVGKLCQRAILLREGHVERAGSTDDVIRHYLSVLELAQTASFEMVRPEIEGKKAQILRAYTEHATGHRAAMYPHDEPVILRIQLATRNPTAASMVVEVSARDATKRTVFTSNASLGHLISRLPESMGQGRLSSAAMHIPARTLVPGKYSFSVRLLIPWLGTVDEVEDVGPITIVDAGSEFAHYEGCDYGVVFVNCKWEIREMPGDEYADAPDPSDRD